MKQTLLILMAVALVGCGGDNTERVISDPIVKEAIRNQLNKPTGELTKADLEKVTELTVEFTTAL